MAEPQEQWVSAAWCAKRLGRSTEWFMTRLPDLLAAGFPKRCRVTAFWEREAVDRWIDGRRTVRSADPPPDPPRQNREPRRPGENLGKL